MRLPLRQLQDRPFGRQHPFLLEYGLGFFRHHRQWLSISTPRFIGPGCIIKACGATLFSLSLFNPNRLKYSRCDGVSVPAMRSVCRRNIITISASAMPLSMSVYTSTPISSTAAGSKVDGQTRRILAPVSEQMDV